MTDQMASSNAPQKLLVGLKVIEVWCWLWVILRAGSAMTLRMTEQHRSDFSPSMVFPLLLGIFPIASLGGGGDVFGLMIFCAVIAMAVAIGFRRRKRWAHEVTQLGGFLTLLNSGLSAFAFIAIDSTESSGKLGWLTIHFVALFRLASTVFGAWVIWYLSQPTVKVGFGVHERPFSRLPSWVLLVVLAVVATLTILGLLFWE